MSIRSAGRGVVLLLALGVLAVLSILATTLVRMTSLERRAASSYALQVRARHAATSGVHLVIAALREYAAATSYDSPAAGWRYHGEDLAPFGEMDANENVFETSAGELNARNCPLEFGKNQQ